MNKKYITIYAMILCLGLGVLLGLVIDKKNSKTNDNTEKNYKKSYIESTYKIDELESDNDKINKQIETEKEIESIYREKIKEKEKLISKLKPLISKSVSENNKYQDSVNTVMNDFYKYPSLYCGEHSNDFVNFTDDVTHEGQYYESYSFTNLADIKSFLNKYLSNNYLNNHHIMSFYKEENNKLYCYSSGKGSLIYEPEGTKFKIISSNDNEIVVYGIVNEYQLNDLIQIESLTILIKENGNWVVDEYFEL